MVLQYQGIGYMASSLSGLSLVPQIVKTFKSKEAEELSIGWILATMSAAILWLTYGIINGIIPQLISSTSLIISCVILLIMKYAYDIEEAEERGYEESNPKTQRQIIHFPGMSVPLARTVPMGGYLYPI